MLIEIVNVITTWHQRFILAVNSVYSLKLEIIHLVMGITNKVKVKLSLSIPWRRIGRMKL